VSVQLAPGRVDWGQVAAQVEGVGTLAEAAHAERTEVVEDLAAYRTFRTEAAADGMEGLLLPPPKALPGTVEPAG
jgi:hypothetical protein